jgi:protein-S-isoprenylcysteine O-methyltransferase Ste14
MKATDFEYRHQTLVHQLIVAAAFLTYLIQRDDVVWCFVKDSTAPRELERFLFALATLLIAFGAGICTWARAYRRPESSETVGVYRYLRHPRHLGEPFYAMGLGSLAPILGFIILVAGEGIRVFRLIRREDDRVRNFLQHPLPALQPLAPGIAKKLDPIWRKAFRQEAVKWGQ